VKGQVSPVLSLKTNPVTIACAVWAVKGQVCLFVFSSFVCVQCVTFRLRQHIGMTQLSAIEKPTISANDFYWRTAPNVSGGSGFKGVGTADPQSSPMGIYNGALLCIIMNINDLN
jgi:hypothetical protein